MKANRNDILEIFGKQQETHMPTEIIHSFRQTTPHPGTFGLNPLTIAAVIALAMLHFIGAIMLERSQAGPAIEISALAAMNDDVKCSTEMERRERSLPYD
jgi:hypothetical protein